MDEYLQPEPLWRALRPPLAIGLNVGIRPSSVRALNVLDALGPLDRVLGEHAGANGILEYDVQELPQFVRCRGLIGLFINDGVDVLRLQLGQRLRSVLLPETLQDAPTVAARAIG
nr:hypothetical protein [Bradyrhizobium sp. ERR14]